MIRDLPIAPAAALIAALAAGCSGQDKKPQEPRTTVDLVTHQAAAIAIGQPSLTTADPSTCGAGMFKLPVGNPGYDGAHLFIADPEGNRIFVYEGVPTTSGALPAFTLGRVDCAPGTPPSASGLNLPLSALPSGSGASTRLIVADYFNARLLIFSPTPASGPLGDAVAAVGQPDTTSNTPGCTRAIMAFPSMGRVVGERLIVPDTHNHRVLVWNQVPTSSGAQADLVLGQATFDSCAYNSDPSYPPGQPTPRTLNMPLDVWSDGTRLAVVDAENHRVLIWNAFPTANGQAADAVIGQPDLWTTSPGLGASSFYYPTAIASDGPHVFVADGLNNRVLGFDSLPTLPVGPGASLVLGQADLTSGTQNEGATSPSASSLSYPSGLAVAGRDLLVTDKENHRVLVFRSSP